MDIAENGFPKSEGHPKEKNIGNSKLTLDHRLEKNKELSDDEDEGCT